MSSLDKRLDEVCEKLEAARLEFEQATTLLATALTAVHHRLEDLESWKKEKESRPT